MGALPVLEYASSTAALPSAVQAFDDPQGITIDRYRVFLSARIQDGATLLILAADDPRLT